MSDRMRLIPFDRLIKWVLSEYKKENTIFGIPEGKYYKKKR